MWDQETGNVHGVYYPHTEVRPAGYMSSGGQDNPVINIAPQWGKKKKNPASHLILEDGGVEEEGSEPRLKTIRNFWGT